MSHIDDTFSVHDFSADPAQVIDDLEEKEHVTLTRNGKGIAVVQTLQSFEADQEEKRFMRGVVQGLTDLENGREMSLDDAKRRLGLI